jgi:hypothetical protein
MRFLHYLPWIALGGLMILHGFAHTPAILGSWDIATFDDVSRQPNILLTNAGNTMILVLGGIWFLAAVSFIVAGIGVLRQAFWWPVVTALALTLSVTMTMLWRHDAAIGLLLNAVILAVMTAMYLIGQWEERKFA